DERLAGCQRDEAVEPDLVSDLPRRERDEQYADGYGAGYERTGSPRHREEQDDGDDERDVRRPSEHAYPHQESAQARQEQPASSGPPVPESHDQHEHFEGQGD